MHFEGIVIAVATFIIIGIFHPIVIKTEYYFGTKAWPVFAIFGTFSLIAATWCSNIIGQAGFGVLSCSFFWSIFELFEQKKRVEKGWFPKRPPKDRAI